MTLRTPPSNAVPSSRAPVHRETLRLDVSDAVPLPGRFEIAADLVLPTDHAADLPLLCCLPGGFLSRRYFDLALDGDRRFSFAEAMAQEGFGTLAFDHVGTGESSKPDPIEGGYRLGVDEIAVANQRALELALGQLATRDPARARTPITHAPTIGVGHSMGSMLTVVQQARFRPHRALALFSFSTRGTKAFLDDAMREYADDPERLRREIGELAERSMGSPYPARATNSESDRRAAFGVGTAPAEAEEALHAASTNLLAVGGLTSMVPGGYAPPARKIDVPVFMLVGDHDLHDDRHTREDLPRSPSVTTAILEDCWHCHFVSNRRASLFSQTAAWIRKTLAAPVDDSLDAVDDSLHAVDDSLHEKEG